MGRLDIIVVLGGFLASSFFHARLVAPNSVANTGIIFGFFAHLICTLLHKNGSHATNPSFHILVNGLQAESSQARTSLLGGLEKPPRAMAPTLISRSQQINFSY